MEFAVADAFISPAASGDGLKYGNQRFLSRLQITKPLKSTNPTSAITARSNAISQIVRPSENGHGVLMRMSNT